MSTQSLRPAQGEGAIESGIPGEVPAAAPSGRWGLRTERCANLALALALFLLLVLGLTRSASTIMGLHGWDEVFAVAGSYCFFPSAILVHHLAAQKPNITRVFGGKLWFYMLQVLLLLTYVAQQCVLIAYLVLHVNKLCWLFVIPDVVVAAMLILFLRMQVAQPWYTLFVLLQAGKLVVLGSQIEYDSDPEKPMGTDGLLGTLMLTIPMVQFPVLISRLRAGMSLTKAYTTNMAAAFAHVLHFMDVLDIYFSGMALRSLPGDVKQLVLFFAVMGHITCNLYYASLFMKDEATVRFLRRFERSGRDGTDLLAPTEPATDDELLHYFLWTVFFIDLPYAVMRLVALVVNGKDVSAFFGKNLMMMVSVVMLLMQGRKA